MDVFFGVGGGSVFYPKILTSSCAGTLVMLNAFLVRRPFRQYTFWLNCQIKQDRGKADSKQLTKKLPYISADDSGEIRQCYFYTKTVLGIMSHCRELAVLNEMTRRKYTK